MLHRRFRSGLAEASALAVMLLLGSATSVFADDADTTGTTTGAITLVVVAGIGIIIVLAWMWIARSRRPPSA